LRASVLNDICDDFRRRHFMSPPKKLSAKHAANERIVHF
jgi:hypothetical protein